MKISELEDSAELVTKEFFRSELRAEIAEFKAEMLARFLDLQARMYQLAFGTYGLIVLAVFVNHLWK
jgi:hypothetical protein